MKKIYALLLIVGFALTLTACGPNSNYYQIKKSTVYTYVNEPININPYELLTNNYSDIKKYMDLPIDEEQLSKVSDNYKIEIEYRNVDSANFENFNFTDGHDGMIYETHPKPTKAEKSSTQLFTNNTYDFKIHFINKDTKSKDDMINIYVTYAFVPALNSIQQTVNGQKDQTYNLLSNISSFDADGNQMTPDQIKAKYDIVYTVTLGSNDISSNVSEDSIDLTSEGTYQVNIQFTEKTETDGNSSASEGSTATTAKPPVVINIGYTIVVNSGSSETTVTTDGNSSASTES